MRKVRVGIIGAGIMGRSHATALADYPLSDVVAVASRGRDDAEQLAASCGATEIYTDYQDLLRNPDIDVVSIALPDHLHAEAALAAAHAGKHMIIEKPLTTSLNEAQRVHQVIQASGVKAMTLFNHRWVPAYAQARAQIADQKIGKPVVGYARKNDWIYVPTKMLSWASGTTPAWFLSSHDIDLMCWFFDDTAEEVYATGVEGVLRRQGVDTLDAVQAQVRFQNGGVATFEACWIYPDTFPTMTDSFMEVIGTDGVIHLDRKREQIEVATNDAFQYPRNLLMMDIHGRPAGAVRNALCHVIDCILEDREPLVSLESSVHVVAILEAIHQSVESRQPVRVGQ